jgi:hypothetical protein
MQVSCTPRLTLNLGCTRYLSAQTELPFAAALDDFTIPVRIQRDGNASALTLPAQQKEFGKLPTDL